MDTFATIRDTAQTFKRIVLEASGGYHDEVYMRVLGSQDTVQFVTQSNARQMLSYCTFEGFDHVDGDAEAIVPVGLDSDTKGWLDYLAIAEGSDTMELRLTGEESDGDHPRFASHWEADGALSASIRLPSSRTDLEKVPWGLPERWNDQNGYVARSGLGDDGTIDDPSLTPPTTIETTVDAVIDSVIEPAEFLDDVNYYPVVVEDGEFRVNLQGNDGDDAIRGGVAADSVDGPDVDRAFDEGFDTVFGNLSGPVRLSTAPSPDDPDVPAPPLVVVQDHVSGKTIRHVLGAFGRE